MAEDDTEKPHEATAKKLEDARKKGEFPKSVDLTTSASYAGMLIVMAVFGSFSIERFGALMVQLISEPVALAHVAFLAPGGAQAKWVILGSATQLAPWFTVPALCALVALVTQRAIVFAPTKLAPKISRISLLSNAKNKFGRSGLFEFLKSFSKLMIYSIILSVFLSIKLPIVLSSMTTQPTLISAQLATLIVELLSLVLVVSIIIGGVDYLWQHAEHLRKNMMSDQEIKDEHKNNEGDQGMKQARRQRGYDIAMNQMLGSVEEADVVIVNPTHFAVALKWDRSRGSVPKCLAKGVDEIAARIRERAAEEAIPIHSDPPTARALYATVEIGQEIRPDHYKAVAAAIRFSDSIRARMSRKSG